MICYRPEDTFVKLDDSTEASTQKIMKTDIYGQTTSNLSINSVIINHHLFIFLYGLDLFRASTPRIVFIARISIFFEGFLSNSLLAFQIMPGYIFFNIFFHHFPSKCK